jgi:DNA-directed RNA polymerase specialized sigma24 family protein
MWGSLLMDLVHWRPFQHASSMCRMNLETRTSLEDVYRAEAPRIWRALVLLTGDHEVASDAVAEAFAQAIGRGDALRDPAAWVWKTAFLVAKGSAAKKVAVQSVVGNTDPAAASDELIDLVRALNKLTAHQRGALILHHYAGYSVREIAAILGSTPSAVGVHLYRARNRLRRELGDDHG